MEIDFKGCKYAVKDINGFVMQFNSEPKKTDYGIGIDDEMFFHEIWTLHTNPDYKETEMNSNKLADEIMQKGKESVYTQEMHSNNEHPVVGMSFLVIENEKENNDTYIEANCISVCTDKMHRKVIVFEYEKDSDTIINCFCYSKFWFKPIDQRTDSEKAIEAIKDVLEAHYEDNGFNTAEIDCTGDAECVFSAINSDMICGVSFTGDKK